MRSILFAALLLAGCGIERGSGYNAFLRACNRVEIVVFNGGDTLYFETRDTTGVRLLVGQVTGNPNTLRDTCAAEGYLRYRQDSALLLQARFAASGAKCHYIAYTYDDDSYANRLSGRATHLLKTVLQQAHK